MESLASFLRSRELLLQVLEGGTCEAVGAAYGLGRTAVDKRIKDLVRRVDRAVGIDGLGEDGLTSLILLRARRASVLAALDRYDPAAKVPSSPSDPVSPERLRLGMERVRSRSDNPNRDVALLYVLFGSGAKPIEIARLTVADYLYADGTVRGLSEIRPEIAAYGRARPLYWRSPRLVEAMDLYLVERSRRGLGAGHRGRYRGLDPDSRLFLTESGEPFAIVAKTKQGRTQTLCWGVHELYRAIFLRAGLQGVTPSLAARSTVALRMRELGAEDAQIGELLGVKDQRTLRTLLHGMRRPIADLAAQLV